MWFSIATRTASHQWQVITPCTSLQTNCMHHSAIVRNP
ncbi:hypothetical protein DO70_3980 [Burkholderia pseudomallei]|nr:hypothetical protein DO70_3980 [Burkholderia pseudomallei]